MTTGLLHATAFIKDNRLRLRGFDKATAAPEIGVFGAASADTSFNGDGDRVRDVINLPAADGPFDVDVELRYQPIGFRWAQNLGRYDTPETRRFVSYFDSNAASSSVVLARASNRAP